MSDEFTGMNILLDIATSGATGAQSQKMTAIVALLLFIAFIGILMWIGYSEKKELESDTAYID